MTFSRPLSRVLLVAVVALASSIYVSTAQAGFAPVFDGSAAASDSSLTISNPGIANADGRVVAVWVDNGGPGTVLKTASLAADSGTWTAATTLSDLGESVSDSEYRIVADSDDNFTAIWKVQGTWHIKARTLLVGDDSWSASDTIDATGGVSGGDLVARADGTVVATWGSYHGSDTVRVLVRAARSTTWGDPIDIDQSGENPRNPAIAFNAAGDGVIVWDSTPSGESTHRLRASWYSHADSSWSTPSEVATTDGIEALRVAISPAGDATMLWSDNSTGAFNTSSANANSEDWSSSLTLTDEGRAGVVVSIVSARDGTMIAAMQDLVYAEDPVEMYSSARVRVRSRDPETGEWSAGTNLANGTFGGIPSLLVDRDYNIVAASLTGDTPDFSRIADGVIGGVRVETSYRPDGASAFENAEVAYDGSLSLAAGMPLAASIDRDGNTAIAIAAGDTGAARHVEAAIGDAAPPELRDLLIPTTGVVGQPVSFSVNPFDLWSDVASTNWAFGDGDSAPGTSVSHTYTAPGVRTVTATATDSAGHQASTDQQLTIVAAPVPPAPPTPAPPVVKPPVVKPPVVKPPVVDPPVIEALLAGTRITIKAQVKLKKGKSCKGTAIATTAYGSRKYRTSLKLKKQGKDCMATGTIRLKKAPSLRAKLRIKISTKSASIRTVTTKRG